MFNYQDDVDDSYNDNADEPICAFFYYFFKPLKDQKKKKMVRR